MKNSSIIRPIIKGILTPILTLSMCISMVSPAFAATGNEFGYIYLPGEQESLGNKYLKSSYSDITTTGSYENPSMLPSFIADESDTALKVLEKNCPQNYTKYVTPEVQMYQTLGWGEPGDDAKKKAEAEENGIATLDTYIRLSSTSKDSDIPAKRYRALYIMSLCSAHAFTWQCAAADCSK